MEAPNAPRNIEGLMQIRNQIVPVYNLHKRFELKEIPLIKDETDIVIVKISGIHLALVIDNIAEIKSLEEEECMAPPAIIVQRDYKYIESVAKYNGELVLILDVDYLFTAEEIQEIQGI